LQLQRSNAKTLTAIFNRLQNFNGMIAVAEGYYVTDHEVTGGAEETLTTVAHASISILFESVAITEEVGEALLYGSMTNN
jgi:hypothetical protein